MPDQFSSTANPRRRKSIVYEARFNSNDDLRIRDYELLFWASGLIEANEAVKAIIRRNALKEFEEDLDDHLRVMEIRIKPAEILKQ